MTVQGSLLPCLDDDDKDDEDDEDDDGDDIFGGWTTKICQVVIDRNKDNSIIAFLHIIHHHSLSALKFEKSQKSGNIILSRVFIELAPCCREEKVLKMSIALHCVLLQVRKNVMKDID